MASEMIERSSVEYKPTYQRFVLKQKSYNQQFSHVYVSRLLHLRSAVAEQIAADPRADGAHVLPKIIDLRDGDECIIIGTTLKVLPHKPDLFDALVCEDGVTPIEQLTVPLASADDQLVLEDESGRVELVGNVDIAQLVTGVVLGVRGVMRAGGANAFDVTDVFVPALPPQPPLPERTTSAFVALVSGLSLGANNCDATAAAQPLSRHVLVDYLAGRLGNAAEKQFVAQIVRTIVVGNSVALASSASTADKTDKTDKATATVEQLAAAAELVKNLDELLASLACSMSVDVLPGASDPSNYALPQQSFHACLFPRSAQFATFRAVTNPYEAEIGGVAFFGHAGQPLASLLQSTLPPAATSSNSGDTDAVDMDTDAPAESDTAADDARVLQYLENCLHWRHAAPTAPDLVACFPMANDDPFVFETCPHVLFAGNQKRFASRMVTGAKNERVRVISVPSFAETSTIVLVDLKDLSCFPITIAL